MLKDSLRMFGSKRRNENDRPAEAEGGGTKRGRAKAHVREQISARPRWQKLMLIAAITLMVLGGGAWAYGAVIGPDSTAQDDAVVDAGDGSDVDCDIDGDGASSDGSDVVDGDGNDGGRSNLVQGLAPVDKDDPNRTADETEERSADGDDMFDTWSPAIFKLGFSFFVGFAIAFAVRTFVKISIITIGVLLLALFGLQYVGVIDVNWSAMSEHFDTFTAWLRGQTATMTAFIQGSLPSAASALGGLVIGFKKK